MERSIKSAQRKVRMIAVRIEGSTGTPSLEGLDKHQCTIVDNGVGDYTITFDKAFAEIPHVAASSEGTDILVKVVPAKGTVQLVCTQVDQDATYGAPAAIDADVQVIVIGSDVTDRY